VVLSCRREWPVTAAQRFRLNKGPEPSTIKGDSHDFANRSPHVKTCQCWVSLPGTPDPEHLGMPLMSFLLERPASVSDVLRHALSTVG